MALSRLGQSAECPLCAAVIPNAGDAPAKHVEEQQRCLGSPNLGFSLLEFPLKISIKSDGVP
jgi:hypothetical protein